MAIPEKCQKCLKNENGRCIAYKEFIGEYCPGYVDDPEDMIKMYEDIKEYAKTRAIAYNYIRTKLNKKIDKWKSKLKEQQDKEKEVENTTKGVK
ncbi:hypothetical protein [Thermoanaerobacter sp. A7A]|uniref:hypothetical protein n=1 Tax=Thermoanaerobacter sp. A7A TaxID=1350366 RepID=UPI00041240D1|nr:hypothetical protein [Thermoanaerobacter sp. A7A]